VEAGILDASRRARVRIGESGARHVGFAAKSCRECSILQKLWEISGIFPSVTRS
jgi:hypothetical protein